MKKLLSLLLAFMMLFALAACGSPRQEEESGDPEGQVEGENQTGEEENASDLAYVMNNGEMIIGYTLYAPMNYYDDNGEFTGFDTELAEIVCEKLGVTPKFIEIVWETKEIELNAKTIDAVWNGLTINEERKLTMEITQPYVMNAQVIVMKADAAYTDTSSLIGKTVVAEQGSAGESTIEGDEALAQATYVPKMVQADCLMEIKSGTADAAVLDLTLAKNMVGEGTNYADLVIVDTLGEEEYGVAFRKGSDLCEAVNQIFNELIADGTMAELAAKYELTLAE